MHCCKCKCESSFRGVSIQGKNPRVPFSVKTTVLFVPTGLPFPFVKATVRIQGHVCKSVQNCAKQAWYKVASVQKCAKMCKKQAWYKVAAKLCAVQGNGAARPMEVQQRLKQCKEAMEESEGQQTQCKCKRPSQQLN